MKCRYHLLGIVFLNYLSTTLNAEWPQFLGPQRNGIADKSTQIKIPNATGEFSQLWKISAGDGHAGPVVVDQKVLLHHRYGDEEILEAFDSNTGKSIWKNSHPCRHSGSYDRNLGTKSTPTVHDGKVYAYGIGGMLSCTNLNTGENLWNIDTARQFQTAKGFFGRCSSPLVYNGLVMLNLGGRHGGKGAGVAAFDCNTGKLIWQATDHEGSYASPIKAKLQGKDTAVFFTREGLVGATFGKLGKPLTAVFDIHFRPAMHASVNAASAVPFGKNRIFASTCYGVGGGAWELEPSGKLRELWQKTNVLDCHFATPILYEEHLYGMHGRQEDAMKVRCIDPATGNILWSSPGMTPGCLLIADSKLVILLESGELVIAEAKTTGFKELTRRQILGTGRSYPAISEGKLYARDDKKLLALKLN